MITEPWWVYPPEINSARILGPGPLPWAVASGIWSVMAAEAAAAQATFQAQNGVQALNLVGVLNPGLVSTASQFSAWLAAVNVEALDAAAANAAVVQAYFSAMGTMIPLPAVIANRVAAATAHAASAAGAVNPAGVALDLQYAGFHVQNAGVMQSYDTLVQVATTPRVFSPPPPLVTGGAASSSSVNTVMKAAQAGISQGLGSTNPKAVGQSAGALASQAGSARSALSPASSQFLSQAGGVSSQMLAAPQTAMGPVSSIMGQMATPMNGATGTGLGTGSGSMASTLGGGSGSSLGARGGLPLGMGGGAATALGGGGMGLGGPAASLLNPMLGNGVSGPGRIGPMFNGVSLDEKGTAARPGTPMGVPPGGAGAGGGQAQRKSSAQTEVERVEIVPVQTKEKLENERSLFR